MTSKKKTLDFESALTELNHLVESIEKGDSTLESSLNSFEKGIMLIRHCQSLLKNAEQRIQVYDKTENTLKEHQAIEE